MHYAVVQNNGKTCIFVYFRCRRANSGSAGFRITRHGFIAFSKRFPSCRLFCRLVVRYALVIYISRAVAYHQSRRRPVSRRILGGTKRRKQRESEF